MYVQPSAKANAQGNFRWIWPYCKPDAPRVLLALFLFLIDKAFTLVMPILAGLVVDDVITKGLHNKLVPYLVAMIVTQLAHTVTRYGYQMLMERFGQNSIYRLVSDEFEKLHTLDFTYFNHTRTGDIMSRMTSDTDAIRHFLSWVTYQGLDCIVMFCSAIAVMFTIDWRLALALACVAPVIFVIARTMAQKSHSIFFEIRNSLARLNSMVEENIEGNRVVKAFVREDYETEKFDEHNDDYFQHNMDLAHNNATYIPWLDGFSISLQLITVVFGGYLVITGTMSLGALVTFQSFLWMIDGPTRQAGWLLNDLQRFSASCIKIRRLLGVHPRVEEPDVPKEEPVKGDVCFDHVSFAFPDDPKNPVLSDLDFHVKPGQKVGILGETGSGKSTLVHLIARFYDPTFGRVLIDGKNAEDYPLATLRSQVALVMQDTFLFSDTIGENIAFGAQRSGSGGNADQEFIRSMAAIAGADSFIRSMPQGYDTVVGERGVGLSGGQKQRLSLARALADNPAILIMDDTTSAVDMETEAEIQKHLRDMAGSKTVFTIAHRISSIKDADLILVLDHGRIVERGNHEDLVAAHGRYWEIYHKQLGLQAGVGTFPEGSPQGDEDSQSGTTSDEGRR
jgi:ATP-binding cassette subfamily B protein